MQCEGLHGDDSGDDSREDAGRLRVGARFDIGDSKCICLLWLTTVLRRAAAVAETRYLLISGAAPAMGATVTVMRASWEALSISRVRTRCAARRRYLSIQAVSSLQAASSQARRWKYRCWAL